MTDDCSNHEPLIDNYRQALIEGGLSDCPFNITAMHHAVHAALALDRETAQTLAIRVLWSHKVNAPCAFVCVVWENGNVGPLIMAMTSEVLARLRLSCSADCSHEDCGDIPSGLRDDPMHGRPPLSDQEVEEGFEHIVQLEGRSLPSYADLARYYTVAGEVPEVGGGEDMEATGIMSAIPEGWYTRQQVAAKIGRSVDTVRRWHHDGTYSATRQESYGKTRVWLYNDADVAEMKKLVRTLKPGRKSGEGR